MNIRIISAPTVEAVAGRIRRLGAAPYAVERMPRKGVLRLIEIAGIDNRAAGLLKQEMLAAGGDAAVSEQVSRFTEGKSDILLMGTLAQYDRLARKLALQPFGLKAAGREIEALLSRASRPARHLAAGRFSLAIGGRPLVMGILNVTPDSFSDGGRYFDPECAVERARAMAAEGADIIDIGGESSRPGSRPVTAAEEKKRVVPVIRAVARAVRVPVSVDTYKPAVAEAALDAGAAVINDISGLRHQRGRMAAVAARAGCPVIIMHMQGEPRTMQKDPRYGDVVGEVSDFLLKQAAFAGERGVRCDGIILDPGIGFGKTAEHNIELLRRLEELCALEYPLLVAASRKAFIGRLSGVETPGERMPGSLAVALRAAQSGAAMVRVHDVAATVQALKVFESIRG